MMNDDQLRALREAPPQRNEEMATDPQERYIGILIEDRDVPESWLLRIKELKESGLLTKPKASQVIVALKTIPKREATCERLPAYLADNREAAKPGPEDVPAGRYAIQTGEDENDLTFYRVKRPYKDKPWVCYVDLIAGPNTYPRPFKEVNQILKNIYRAGAANAAILYGRKVGRCSVCHTQITNRVSRELGIGPVCGGRFFSDWEDRVNNARRTLVGRGLNPDENVEEDQS